MKSKKEVKWFECCPEKKQQPQEPCSDIRQGKGSLELHWNSNLVVCGILIRELKRSQSVRNDSSLPLG